LAGATETGGLFTTKCGAFARTKTAHRGGKIDATIAGSVT
jgi:hypothetical protein